MDIKPLTVLITGTNKGIGYELVKVFLEYQKQYIIIATSRQAPEIAYKTWEEIDKKKRVVCKQLNMLSQQSILNMVEEIKKENLSISILINNAGVSKVDEFDIELPSQVWAQDCLRVNLLAQIELTEGLLPVLSTDCKIINVGSAAGALNQQPSQTKLKFDDQNITKEDIISAAHQYIQEVIQKKLTNFSPNVYGTSKMLLHSWGRHSLRKQLKETQICINLSPGLCATQMAVGLEEKFKMKAHTAESGAQKIYETIFLPDLSDKDFYHRARKTDFYTCGGNLPRE